MAADRVPHLPVQPPLPTALVAFTLADAERLCTQLNARLGLDRDAWMKMAARAMRDAGGPSSDRLH